MSAFNGGGWRNVVIGVLTSALLAVGVAWFSFGANVVRKDELRVEELVRKDELKELHQTVVQLERTVAQLTTTVAVLSERVRATAP